MPNRIVDGRRSDSLPIDDRGLAYGDGLFETIRFHAGRAPLWPLHMQRLRLGARRLRLAMAVAAQWWQEARSLAGDDDCVIKLILTRGDGRGYAPLAGRGRRIVLRDPMPEIAPSAYQRGLRLRWCRLRLATQPMLAGLKHLNRLEQVLARSEWSDPRIDEGLLLDAEGRVISATAANLFVVHHGRLLTPRLNRCGVAGVARAWLLRTGRSPVPVLETDLSPGILAEADELFLSNAVRGVQPIRAIGRRRWPIGPVTKALGATLAGLGIGVAPGADLDPEAG